MRERDRGRFVTARVVPREPICESDRERVFDVPVSDLYRSEVTAPDGTIRVFDGIRAYVDSIVVEDDGKILIGIKAKSSHVRAGRIPYPYNYLCEDRVLCVLKRYEMRMKSDAESKTFALTYNLFCLPWESCLLIHKFDGDKEPLVALTSRGEWERGELNAHNQEVQMFLPITNDRHVPIEVMRSIVNKGIATWMNDCLREVRRKGA